MFKSYDNWFKIQNGHQNLQLKSFLGKCIMIQNTNNLRCCNKVIIECFIYSKKMGDALKGLLLCLITNYFLIFLLKAQITADSTPLPPFISILLITSQIKKKLFFVSKTFINWFTFWILRHIGDFSAVWQRVKHWKCTQRILEQRLMMCYKTDFWIENCGQIQNGGHYRQTSCDKTL